MFARTQRLMLRPGWAEDAPDLARAIAFEEVVRNLGRAPWPYALGDAKAFLADQASVASGSGASFLICAFDHGVSRIVGGIGFGPYDDEPHEFGYWITPDAWGRGFATEAGRAVIDIARTLRVPRLSAGHYVDNPASGRVLRKLGFQPTGRVVPRYARGRGGDVQCVEYEQRLDGSDVGTDPCDGRMAA
ncbi:GNAT family N-acetyltransferase [Sphingomonas suaedae]|uniref:GNAT family N-acetyltransferase n=1 Tax=Sphingomonas suaedae TaxID=2599297 RepID=A0A518RKD8_9SPHN|nr:GNAT family N-acetyltransferase [Sphingomonas suaedae]QDX27922.1 GNAT family N-acetyltransferase [Sphingomonas suaedae]